MRQPIYENCPLTQDESDLLIMSFIIRHGLTDLAFDDLLNLINCHLPITLNFARHFLKKFPKTANMKTIFYCPECFVELNFEQMTHINCTSCNIWYMRIDLVRSGHYFVHLPLKDQLRNLLSGPLFYKLQRGCAEQSSILSDITSGESYRRLRRNGVIRDYDITLQWNADGVDTFKSSKVSMCPIQVAINELPYCLRKENILLSSIWCSAKKSVMDLFLKPFVDDLKDLHENAFHCLPPGLDAPVHVRVHTIVAPVDSVARCALQNVHQFNGKFGCSFCLCPGDRVKVGNGYARVYLEKGKARTKNQHLKDSQKAVRKENVVRGVKGMSHLMFVPGFDIIQSFPPEYMHSILLGVIKSFIIVWFTNCHNPSYISTKKDIFDEKLTSIRPPSEITRTPRSINDIKVRKASELKNFLLYYSMPCLKNVLSKPYYKHWSLLFFAIYKFLCEKITNEDYVQAERALQIFVERIPLLYGAECMKYNVHLLLHIPKSIKYFGALLAWSAFPYESYNYVMRKMLHSSQFVLKQICKFYLRLQNIKYNDTFNKRNCNQEGKKLFNHMLGHNKSKYGQARNANNDIVKIIGTGKNILLNLVEKISIQALINERIENNNGKSYQRFIYNGITYHSNSYNRMYKRNNSIIQTELGELMTIKSIISVILETGDTAFVVVGNSIEILEDIILCSHYNISSASYCYAVEITNNILTCKPEQITNKCILLSGDNDTTNYIMPLVNNTETD